MKNKIYIAIIIVIAIYAIITTFENRKIESKYNALVEKEINFINDSITKLNEEIKDLTQKQKLWTKSVQKESQDINDKLKQDEKTIDNDIYSHADLYNFIAKHEN